LLTDVNGGGEKRRQEAEPEDEKGKGQTVHVGAASSTKEGSPSQPRCGSVASGTPEAAREAQRRHTHSDRCWCNAALSRDREVLCYHDCSTLWNKSMTYHHLTSDTAQGILCNSPQLKNMDIINL
jgi:hypothetical protein